MQYNHEGMMANTSGLPESAIFVILDIERYSKDRTDLDRQEIRYVLQQVVRQLLTSMKVTDYRLLLGKNDTGDGVIIALDSTVGIGDIVMKLYPRLEAELREHNKSAVQERHIRLRMSVTVGPGIFKNVPLTGLGMVSSALNLGSRLIDARQLRGELVRRQDLAAVMIVSDEVYHALERGHPGLAQGLRRVVVDAKDGKYEGYIYALVSSDAGGPGDRATVSDAPLPDNRVGDSKVPVEASISSSQIESLPTHLYMSTFDTFIGKLYGNPPLGNQLATAILLTSGAIVHSIDPYRSPEICSILEDYKDFIDDGHIKFLVSSSIVNLRADYERYILERIQQFARTGFGETDVVTLEDPGRGGEAQLERALALLESAKEHVIRGHVATNSFRDYLERDLETREKIYTIENPLGKLQALNLSLNQILNLSLIDKGKTRELVASREHIRVCKERLSSLVQQERFSRQIVIAVIDQELQKLRSLPSVQKMIAARVHLLFLTSTVKPHPFVEVTQRRDERSPFYFGFLLSHLNHFIVGQRISEFSPNLVRALLEAKEWPAFARHHLACVAEYLAHRMADSTVVIEDVFTRRSHGIDHSFVDRAAKGI